MKEVMNDAKDIIVKKCFLPDLDKKRIKNTSFLLELIRLEVRAAKLADPILNAYSLHDMGFIQKENGMEIMLYFKPKEVV